MMCNFSLGREVALLVKCFGAFTVVLFAYPKVVYHPAEMMDDKDSTNGSTDLAASQNS